MKAKINPKNISLNNFCNEIFNEFPKCKLYAITWGGSCYKIYYGYFLDNVPGPYQFIQKDGLFHFFIENLTDDEEMFLKLKYGN